MNVPLPSSIVLASTANTELQSVLIQALIQVDDTVLAATANTELVCANIGCANTQVSLVLPAE